MPPASSPLLLCLTLAAGLSACGTTSKAVGAPGAVAGATSQVDTGNSKASAARAGTAIRKLATVSHKLVRPLGVAGVSHTQTLSWDADRERVGFVVKHPTEMRPQYFSVARDRLSGRLSPTPTIFPTEYGYEFGFDFMTRWPPGATQPTVVARGGIKARTAPESSLANGWVWGEQKTNYAENVDLTDLWSLVNAEDGAILYADDSGFGAVWFQRGADPAVQVFVGGPGTKVDQLSLIQRPNTTDQYTMIYRQDGKIMCRPAIYSSDARGVGFKALNAAVELSLDDPNKDHPNRLSRGAFFNAAALNDARIVIVSSDAGSSGWRRQTLSFDCDIDSLTSGDEVDEARYRRAGMPQIAVHGDQVFIVVQGSLHASSELYRGRVVGWIGRWDGTAFTDPRRVIIGTGELASVIWAGDRWVVSYFDTDGDLQIVSGSFEGE